MKISRMKNELNLNIDEVLNFIKDFELTEDNVHDIIKYVQYKSILDSFTYVIEFSKNSLDTGLFAIKYIEVTKELDSIIKMLVEKKNSKKMEQNKLSKDDTIFGWDVDYYLTEKTVDENRSELYKIVDKIRIKVLIPEGYEKDSEKFVVEIPIEYFPKNKEPHINDMVFFNEFMRFYSVSNSLKVEKLYRVKLEKYCIKS